MKSLALAYAMKRKAKKMADGGSASQTLGTTIGYPGSPKPRPKMAEGGLAEEAEAEAQDVVDRIMSRRANCMSEGGKVANGSMTEALADESPNEFDDLVLRDDLESSSDGENNGDFIGDEQEDADRRDIVARVMRSRAKKDRLPNPR